MAREVEVFALRRGPNPARSVVERPLGGEA
jgi:hypothetical protein